MHEVILPTHNREDFSASAMCGRAIFMENELAQPRATEVGSCAFSCKVFAPVALESSSLVA